MSLSDLVQPRTGTLDADTYARFAAHVRSLLPFDRFSLGTIERDGAVVVLAYAEGAEVNGLAQGEAVPIGESLARYVRPGGDAVIQGDLLARADHGLSQVERMDRDSGLRTVVTIPLASANELVGILNLWSKAPDAYVQEQLTPLLLLAPLITAALRNARAQRRAEELAREAGARADELADSRAWLHSAYQALPCGVMTLDSQGRIQDVNEACEEILGLPKDALIGALVDKTPVHLTHRDGVAFELGAHLAAPIGHGARSFRRLPLRTRRPDGSERLIEMDAVPQARADGTVRQVVLSFIDLTEQVGAEQALRTSQELLSTAVSNAPIVITMIDSEGMITFTDGRGLERLGRGPGNTVGTSAFSLFADSPVVLDCLKRVLAGEPSTRMVNLGAGVFEARYSPLFADDGTVRGAITVSTDVTERVRNEEALRVSDDRFHTMLDMSPVGACIVSEAGTFESVNAAICELYEYTAEELIGQPLSMMFSGEPRRERREESDDHPPAYHLDQGEFDLVTKSGQHITVLSRAVQFTGDDGSPRRAAFVFDITERKQAEDQLNHAAYHDALTGLPNRVLYYDRLQQALLLARRQGQTLSILVIDLNGFKQVNDLMGHEAGDELLREVAIRLQGIMRAGDTVARLGGDEFAVVLPQADEAGATRVANKIRAALAPAVLLNGQEAYVGGSVGIAVLGEHGDDVESLQRAADLAMYAAKAAGGGFSVYMPEHGTERRGQKERRPSSLAADLREAITQGDLRLHYQPLVSCSDGQVRRVEALVRWQHPERGLLSPDSFIVAAEQAGAITPLTIWVLEEALRQCREWNRNGLALGVAVNVSLRTLREAQFPDLVSALLRQYEVAPADLTLEITENSMLEEQEQTLRVLRDLNDLGVRIALDDVGVGHSSLGYITQLPVHELKVDRSFLSAPPGSKGHAVVCCILGLGMALDLSVVVEGVETREAWDWLIGMGCDWGQGYFMSRALPASALEDWFREHPALEQGSAIPETRPASEDMAFLYQPDPMPTT